MPAFFAPSRTASAYASASATRTFRRVISRTRRTARARSSARPRSPAASVCSARSNRLRANEGSGSRLEATRSFRAAARARFAISGVVLVVRRRSNGCPHTSQADRPSGTSDSQRGQRAMWLQPRGRPPHREGMTPLDVGCAGINEASSISHLITVWLGPVATRFPKSFSSRAPIARPSGPSRAGRTRRCLGLAGRRGRSLVGMAVVDGEGVEVGYVSGEEANTLVLGEGSGGRMRLGRRFVSGIVDRVTLRGPAAEIFAGLNVIDSDGEFVGIVRDTNEADDVLDSFIVEDESGEMVNVLLEDVRSIDEWVELSVAGDSLYEKG